jgi:hypothetical protein
MSSSIEKLAEKFAREIDLTVYHAICEATTKWMSAIKRPPGLVQLSWSVEIGAGGRIQRLVGRPQVLDGPDVSDVLNRWAQLLSLQPAKPDSEGTEQYRGTFGGLPTEIWGVVDSELYYRGRSSAS